MQIVEPTFADVYHKLIETLPNYPTSISCRNMNICYELVNVELKSTCNQKVSAYSHFNSRVVPIRFILAEFLWIISASNELSAISRFNSRMTQFSDDKVVLNGAYGFRLLGQLESVIEKMIGDKHTRQAYCTIFHPENAIQKSKDIPCNTSMQFIIRDDRLHFRVISRSSDFVTGMSIDMVHWQLLHHVICNTLRKTYSQLLTGDFVYHIGSLHVYDIDKHLMAKWKTDLKPVQYTHDFHIRDTYESLKKKAQTEFLEVEMLSDLGKLYNFSLWEMDELVVMNKDFIRQKERPVR